MTSRTRNLSIIAAVLVVLAGAIAVIVTKETVLGLDLRGGVELVYEGRQATPQSPPVTPENIEDAIETIRKRTDALGVSDRPLPGRDRLVSRPARFASPDDPVLDRPGPPTPGRSAPDPPARIADGRPGSSRSRPARAASCPVPASAAGITVRFRFE